MDLRNIDLNLLLLFSHIYRERSISRAAIKLNLSQSAVSNSLAKLRERLQDPLFTRTSRGMTPTLGGVPPFFPTYRAAFLCEMARRSATR